MPCPWLTRAVHHLPVCRLGPSSAALASTQRTNSVLPGKPRPSRLCGAPVASACWARPAGQYLSRPVAEINSLMHLAQRHRAELLLLWWCHAARKAPGAASSTLSPARLGEHQRQHAECLLCWAGQAGGQAADWWNGSRCAAQRMVQKLINVPPCFGAAAALQPRWNH